jgi:hypothetical protein
MHQEDLLSWDVTDSDEHTAPPQTVINIVSQDMLQVTVTKTALEVFSNLAQVSVLYITQVSIAQVHVVLSAFTLGALFVLLFYRFLVFITG